MGAKPATVPPPRTINLASLALVLEAIAWIGPYLAVKFGESSYKSYLREHGTYSAKVVLDNSKHYVESSAGKSKTFHFKDANQPYSPAKVTQKIADSVAQTQHAYLLQAFILAAALLLLGYCLRRTRGASPARWSVVVVAVLTQSPLLAFNLGRGLPAGFGVATGLIGILAIISLVLLFVPQSRQYFRAVRESLAAVAPPRPARPGRTGGGLFGSRVASPTAKPVTKAAKVAPKQSEPVDLAKPVNAHEKKRAEAAAVAKGAALARSRAKAAAKSRRMED